MRNDRRAGTGARAVINQSINQYIDPFFHPRHLCPHAVMGRSTSPDPISRGPTRTHQQIAYEQSPDNDLPPARCRIKRGQSRQFNDLDCQEELCQGTSMTIPPLWTIIDDRRYRWPIPRTFRQTKRERVSWNQFSFFDFVPFELCSTCHRNAPNRM